jgi:hypothetical protein
MIENVTEVQPPPRGVIATSLLPANESLRRVRVPFVLILICGVAFVIGYYTIPRVAAAGEAIADLKARFGYGFSAVGGFAAGVIVPETFKRLTIARHRILPRIGELLMDGLYFIFMAVLVDMLYRWLGWQFGYDTSLRTVATKTAIDQFIFTPTLGTGIAAIYFPLRKANWDLRFFNGFGLRWYVRVVMPILLPAWLFWIPAVAMIYSLPPLLQIPFSLCATAAWSLLMIMIAKRELTAPAFTAAPAPSPSTARRTCL